MRMVAGLLYADAIVLPALRLLPPDSRDAAAVAAILASGSAACAVPRFEPSDDATIETDSKEEDERRSRLKEMTVKKISAVAKDLQVIGYPAMRSTNRPAPVCCTLPRTDIGTPWTTRPRRATALSMP